MITSRFSEAQIVAILNLENCGIKVKDLSREHGISDATYLQLEDQIRWPTSV